MEQLGARQNSGRFGKGLRLKRSKTGQLRTPSIWNKVWTNKQKYCNNINILVQSDWARNCNVNQKAYLSVYHLGEVDHIDI